MSSRGPGTAAAQLASLRAGRALLREPHRWSGARRATPLLQPCGPVKHTNLQLLLGATSPPQWGWQAEHVTHCTSRTPLRKRMHLCTVHLARQHSQQIPLQSTMHELFTALRVCLPVSGVAPLSNKMTAAQLGLQEAAGPWCLLQPPWPEPALA